MKVRIIILAIGLVLGLLITSCSASSKTCPAYSDATVEMQAEINS
jgi:hypothetical protein